MTNQSKCDMIGMLKYTDAEAFFAYRSRRIELKIAPPITGPKRPAVCLSKNGQMGGVAVSSGVYQIANQVNGKRYVGSAVNLAKRWRDHLGKLSRNIHANPHLQAAFDKYGMETFVFSVLEHIDDTFQLIPREQHYLDTLKPEYNISPTAGSPLGYRHTEEARRKIGRPNSKHSPETRAKMRASWTPERREALSKARKNRPHSAEHRRRIGDANRNPSPETRRKIGAAHKGKHVSEQTRFKLSVALKTYWRRIDTAKKQEEENGDGKI